jgi:hypothetical protein
MEFSVSLGCLGGNKRETSGKTRGGEENGRHAF